MHKLFTAVMLVGSVVLASCGGAPDAEQLCEDSCDKQASCNMSDSATLSACKNSCATDNSQNEDDVQIVHDDCKNPDTVLDAVDHCVKSYCDSTDVSSCVNTALGKCDEK